MSDVDFAQALRDANIPTTEAGLRKAWEKEVADQAASSAIPAAIRLSGESLPRW